jgi:hypothetical protein
MLTAVVAMLAAVVAMLAAVVAIRETNHWWLSSASFVHPCCIISCVQHRE